MRHLTTALEQTATVTRATATRRAMIIVRSRPDRCLRRSCSTGASLHSSHGAHYDERTEGRRWAGEEPAEGEHFHIAYVNTMRGLGRQLPTPEAIRDILSRLSWTRSWDRCPVALAIQAGRTSPGAREHGTCASR